MKAGWDAVERTCVVDQCSGHGGALSGTAAGGRRGRPEVRAFILDTRDGHVWIWSENELITVPDGSRSHDTGFVYQGKLRSGARPGKFMETPQDHDT